MYKITLKEWNEMVQQTKTLAEILESTFKYIETECICTLDTDKEHFGLTIVVKDSWNNIIEYINLHAYGDNIEHYDFEENRKKVEKFIEEQMVIDDVYHITVKMWENHINHVADGVARIANKLNLSYDDVVTKHKLYKDYTSNIVFITTLEIKDCIGNTFQVLETECKRDEDFGMLLYFTARSKLYNAIDEFIDLNR